jgi:hypothetical protein
LQCGTNERRGIPTTNVVAPQGPASVSAFWNTGSPQDVDVEVSPQLGNEDKPDDTVFRRVRVRPSKAFAAS